MALGFQDLGSTQRRPDRGQSKKVSPTLLKIQFGDGYEQRVAEGLNTIKETFSVSFNNRPKAEIDDIIAFFDNKNGTSPLNGSTAFAYTIPDSNQGSGERTIQVVRESYSQTYSHDDFYSCSATFRRVYES